MATTGYSGYNGYNTHRSAAFAFIPLRSVADGALLQCALTSERGGPRWERHPYVHYSVPLLAYFLLAVKAYSSARGAQTKRVTRIGLLAIGHGVTMGYRVFVAREKPRALGATFKPRHRVTNAHCCNPRQHSPTGRSLLYGDLSPRLPLATAGYKLVAGSRLFLHSPCSQRGTLATAACVTQQTAY